MQPTSRLPLKGIVFDMDGTLTKDGAIDFADMRKRANIPEGSDILKYIHSLPAKEREHALKIIDEVEVEGHRHQQLMPGMLELMQYCDSRGIKRGLLTRNTMKSVDVFLAMSGCWFDKIVTRDFVPTKPNPEPLLHICKHWDFHPQNVMMVGDWVDDIMCGKEAGASTCLVITPKGEKFVPLADYSVCSLPEIQVLMEKSFLLP